MTTTATPGTEAKATLIRTTPGKPRQDQTAAKLQVLSLAVEAARGQNWTSSVILKLADDMWNFLLEA